MKVPILFYPEPVVGAFILNSKNEILLVKSYKWKGVWTVPGGHIELGETIESAAVRETEEEIGLRVEFKEVFAVFDAINPERFYKLRHFIFLECLLVSGKNDQIKIDNQEIQTAKWFDIEVALKKKLETYTDKSLRLLNKKFIDS